MRLSFFHLCIRALAGAALLATTARAAELGDIAVRSYIGQPLAADIELVALSPEEAGGLQVRLAQADVYRGANVAMHPALASVRMEVVTRGQRQFLHVTTTRAVDADYVHLYVALGAAGRQEVRLATVWLQADPNPAPVAVAVTAPPVGAMTSAQAEQIAARARAEREVARTASAGSAASGAAAATAAARDRTRPAPLPSPHESEVGTPGAVKAAAAAAPPAPVPAFAAVTAAPQAPAPTPAAARGLAAEPGRRTPSASVRDLPERIAGVLVTPRGSPVKPSVSKEAAVADGAVPLGVAQALLPLPPLPLPKGVQRPAAPAACAPTGMSAKECVALDSHNAALSSKLVELEGKLKALQGAVGGVPGAAGGVAKGVAKGGAKGGAKGEAASASAAGQMEPEAHAAKALLAAPPGEGTAAASAASVSASASRAASAASSAAAPASEVASASAAASASAGASASAAVSASAAASASASVPVKQVRVLPKLKYKKEKPVEKPADYTLPLAAGGVGLLALLGAGLIYLRKRKAGGGPLKIWQGFRNKKADPAPDAAPPLAEAAPESLAQ